MKKKHVEEKLADLVQAFHERNELSVKEIQDLISCNRQSVYNYIDRLAERGFCIQRKTKSRAVYFSLIQGNAPSANDHYIRLSPKILRKYSIIQQLHLAPYTPKTLASRFLIFPSGQKPEFDAKKIPIDIAYTYFNTLVKELETEDEILIAPNGFCQPTGRTIPILHHFSDEDLFLLQDQLKSLPEGSPYHGQLQSIAKKMEVIETSYNLGASSNSNYLTYGRNHEMLSQIGQWMKKISDTGYTENLIRLEYTTRSGNPFTVLFETGLIIYSIEKAKLYLLGKEFSEQPQLTANYDSIIDVSTITHAENTSYPNNSYYSASYQRVFSEMFSVSLEKPMKVVVRFDLVANVKRKILYLQQQRSQASLTMYPDENQLEYTDTIRGLGDFANYLRQFGRSAHVIAPAELKEKMQFSVNRTLARYEEESHE